MLRISSFLLSAVLLLGFQAVAPAQIGCLIGDDGFAAAPCCTPVFNVNLPQFPPFQTTGDYACIKDCNLEATFQVTVTTSHNPLPGVCDYAIIPITVFPAGPGAPGWVGTLVAKYSRTWLEPSATGAPDRQVWRFLINGMLNPTAGTQPCPLPPHPAGDSTHFHGHVDYACEFDPTSSVGFSWRMALNLNHLPGCISHHPIISAKPLPPGPDHADRSYHLVAPGGFVFAPVPEPAGPTPAEAVRSAVIGTAGYMCTGEAPIVSGSIGTLTQSCLCIPGATGPFDWKHQTITGTVPCAGVAGGYAAFPLPPALPPVPTGFATMPLGGWAAPTPEFPNGRDLLIHWGVLQYVDPCNPSDFPLHIVTGLSTVGHPGFLFGPTGPGAIYNVFMDLQHSLLPSGLLGPLTIGWGDLFFSKLVWNINLP